MTIDDVLAVRLETGQPVPTALSGAPYESWHVIHDDGRVERETIRKTDTIVKTR